MSNLQDTNPAGAAILYRKIYSGTEGGKAGEWNEKKSKIYRDACAGIKKEVPVKTSKKKKNESSSK